jgi:mycolipenoyl-CoA---2-(long-chain-fatty acyl)-trehalose mycolipenoyltransferase / long-chain-acyl-CoA---trehalose acyltransferase
LKLTEISKYEAQPGRLVEWSLHPTTVAASAAAPQDPRPPSFTQDAHVKTTAFLRGIGLEAPTWLATAFDVPGALDVDAMDATFLQWIARHETLRSELRLTGEELERFTVSAEDVSLERTFVDDFTSGADVVSYLEDRFDQAANPLAWPAYIFVTVARDDGFTVYLAFDHTNVDGYSIALIAYEIHELYAATLAGRPAELAEVGSYVDFSEIERASSDDLDADHQAVARWRDVVDTCGDQLPAFPLDLGIAAGEYPQQTGGCTWLIDPSDAEAFDEVCKAVGGNVAAGVTAAAGAAAYELGDVPVYRTVIPFHTRSELQWLSALGWYIGLAPLEVATTQAADFHDLVRMSRRAARVARPVAQAPFAKVFSLLEPPVRPLSVMSYIDARVVPGAAHWTDWNAHAFGKVSYGDEVYLWINRTLDGMYVTYRYPDTEVARRNVTAYIDRMRDIITSVAQTGTYDVAGQLPAERWLAA